MGKYVIDDIRELVERGRKIVRQPEKTTPEFHGERQENKVQTEKAEPEKEGEKPQTKPRWL